MDIDRTSAEVWASWFRALGDATHVLILHQLATAGQEMTVGEIVDTVDVGQSTVSHHLELLTEVRFVHVERRANTSLYRVNPRCLAVFPSAAELVMGQLPRYDPLPAACDAPWQTDCAKDDLSPDDAAESPCTAGAVTRDTYRTQLEAAGFTRVEITDSHQIANGYWSVLVRATKPTT
jgi:DNA-binding transcriptional ArsR family regulator